MSFRVYGMEEVDTDFTFTGFVRHLLNAHKATAKVGLPAPMFYVCFPHAFLCFAFDVLPTDRLIMAFLECKEILSLLCIEYGNPIYLALYSAVQEDEENTLKILTGDDESEAVMFYLEAVDLNKFKGFRYLFDFIEEEWVKLDEPNIFDTISYALFETPEELAVKH